MKANLILTLIIYILVLTNQVIAFDNKILSKIENNIYGFDYINDTNENRINRLEKTVYGKNFSGDINKRVNKLSADISADVIGLEIEPARDTFLAEENAIEDADVEYPIVDEIEKKLFNKTYRNRDFHTRIVTIEKKLFGKIYDVDDYSKRMERIKEKVMPERIVQQNNDKNEIYTPNFKSLDYYTNMPYGQRNYSRPYINYGDFSGINDAIAKDRDNLSENLSQLEYDTFGTEFSNEDATTRIKRLNSVSKAKKSSSKYDSQKFAQHMSTAMEIGAMILMILAMVL